MESLVHRSPPALSTRAGLDGDRGKHHTAGPKAGSLSLCSLSIRPTFVFLLKGPEGVMVGSYPRAWNDGCTALLCDTLWCNRTVWL